MNHKRTLMSVAMATVVLLSLCAVCGSPLSVSAANGSSTQPQASGALVDAGSGAAPAVCWEGANNFDVFVKGADSALWVKHFNGVDSSQWKSLGGNLTSDPAVTTFTGSGINIDVFVRGTNGALYERNSTSGGDAWNPWHMIGGQLLAGTGPTAYNWGASRIGWFVTGTNHQLYHMWEDTTGLHGWENLGGYLTSSPAAVSLPQLMVFVRGNNGALYERNSTSGGDAWGSWTSLGGQIPAGTSPTACCLGGRADVFVQGMNSALYHRSIDYLHGGSWSAWDSPGGYLTSSPSVAVSFDSSNIVYLNVLVRGSNGSLYWGKYTAFSWSGWTSVGSTP